MSESLGLIPTRSAQLDTPQHGDKGRLLEVFGLGVKYVLGAKREDLQSLTYRVLLGKRKKRELWALKDVDIVGYSGDVLAIVGANGVGKTTLCRVLAGLLRPDVGTLRMRGAASALMSFGAGFDMQLSGQENIFRNGLMLGLSKRKIQSIYPDIIEFSGLQQFIEQPVKTYSSGMKARLGFSIAAMLEPEILIIDEALSVGDLEFRRRAGEKMQALVNKAKLVILVSHQLGFVQDYCTRVLWLDQGGVRADGPPSEILSLYRDSMATSQVKRTLNLSETLPKTREERVIDVRRLGVQFSMRKRKKHLWALKDVNFHVNAGEVVGIIGPNGAGKTTLCRVLSGILRADKGQVSVKGKISALLTLGTGFNDQLPGGDNIYLNGMMLGIPKKRLKSIYSDIIEFSELEKFIDEPVKHFSRGMQARLGFSIAAMVKPDIFLIDEALSAGDAAFYERASAKIQELITQANTVMVVTHNMAFVEKVCTRVLWLDRGGVQFDGNPGEAVAGYRHSLKS